MRSVFDELEGLLGKDQIDKIRASTGLKNRLEKSDELFSVYDDEADPNPDPVRRTSRTEDDPPARKEPAGDQSLADLTKTLQGITAKLGDVPTKADMDAAIKKGGDELFTSITGRVLRQTHELSKIERTHLSEFGEEFDGEKFNEFVNTQMKEGRSFKSITDAYNDYVGERRTDAKIEKGVREGLKKRAAENQGSLVPGVTPPSSKSPISVFSKRGKEADGSGNTAIDRAGAALDTRLSAQASEA